MFIYKRQFKSVYNEQFNIKSLWEIGKKRNKMSTLRVNGNEKRRKKT